MANTIPLKQSSYKAYFVTMLTVVICSRDILKERQNVEMLQYAVGIYFIFCRCHILKSTGLVEIMEQFPYAFIQPVFKQPLCSVIFPECLSQPDQSFLPIIRIHR